MHHITTFTLKISVEEYEKIMFKSVFFYCSKEIAGKFWKVEHNSTGRKFEVACQTALFSWSFLTHVFMEITWDDKSNHVFLQYSLNKQITFSSYRFGDIQYASFAPLS